jgi:hypothetical protein
MGYTTTFTGILKFTSELTLEQSIFIDEINQSGPGDFIVSSDKTGIVWAGFEKTYDAVTQINSIIEAMQIKWPEFGLTGRLLAQGEEIGDVWHLVIDENGVAQEVRVEP